MPVKPRVSAIITTRNRADLLVEAVRSVLSQTFRDFELIVADHGSSDDTAERVLALDDPIRYLQLGKAERPDDIRNFAISAARGELIAFLDDDDIWRPDKLALQVAAFDHDRRLGMAYSDVQLLHPDGSLSEPVLAAAQKRSDMVFDNLLVDCFIHPSTVMIHRRLFDQIGRFTTSVVQADYMFWLQAAQTARVGCLPEPLVYVRRFGAGVSDARGIKNYENAIEVLETVRASGRLTWRQHLIVRRTLSRWHTHVGLALQTETTKRAQSHFSRSLRLNPIQRRAWLALLSRP